MPSVLITGAGRGFGRALVSVYAARGWTIFPLVRDEAKARQLEVEEAGSSCFPFVADISRDETESIVAEALRRRTESLDILVNNAGQIVKNRGFLASSASEIESLFQVHCLGAFRCTRASLPFLEKARPGTVINITSRFGSLARTLAGRGSAIYSYQIAKCAQNMLSVFPAASELFCPWIIPSQIDMQEGLSTWRDRFFVFLPVFSGHKM